MKTTVQILRDARELYAAAPSHAPASASPEAGTYCVLTALDRVTTPYGASDAAIRAFVLAACGSDRVVGALRFNATHSTAEVLAVFDKAIAAQSEPEPTRRATIFSRLRSWRGRAPQ